MKKLKDRIYDGLCTAVHIIGDRIGGGLDAMMKSSFHRNYPKISKTFFYGTLRFLCFICREDWDEHKPEFDRYYNDINSKNTKLNSYLDGVE
jgi:hypothetical protein